MKKKYFNVEIIIYNHKIMKLKLKNRYIRYFSKNINLTIVEHVKNGKIYNDIKLVDYDNNYSKKRYEFYENISIFSIEYPYGKVSVDSCCKIKNIDDYEFEHTIPTDN